MSYILLGADGRPYTSDVKGQWGGHRGTRVYGLLDCPSALRVIARGGYAWQRVFFADEATAIAAGYRPCASCCKDHYRAWKRANGGGGTPLPRRWSSWNSWQKPYEECGLLGPGDARWASLERDVGDVRAGSSFDRESLATGCADMGGSGLRLPVPALGA